MASQWTNEEAGALATSLEIANSQPACKPCTGDINRLLKDDQFTLKNRKVTY